MKSPKVVLSLVVLCVVGASVWLGIVHPGRTGIAKGPMVQMLRTDGFTLVWHMADDRPVILSVLNPQDGQWINHPGRSSGEGRYEVTVDELNFGTVYEYIIRAGKDGTEWETVAKGKLRTAPLPGGEFRFLAFGDSGTASSQQYALARQMPAFEPDMVIHTGDLVMPSGRREDYPKKFYQPYADLLKRSAFYPSIGNHDYDDFKGEPMLQEFVLPDNGPPQSAPGRHYWFDFGDARFICFDSNETFAGLQEQVVPWIKEVLEKADGRWKIVYFHHPVFTGGKYDPSGKVMELMVPLFDEYGVHLVFNGHNHMYERSKPIRDGRVVPEGSGTVYITTGAGGDDLYRVQTTMPDFLVMQDNTIHSFTVVDVTPEKLKLRQIALGGALLDQFEITKR